MNAVWSHFYVELKKKKKAAQCMEIESRIVVTESWGLRKGYKLSYKMNKSGDLIYSMVKLTILYCILDIYKKVCLKYSYCTHANKIIIMWGDDCVN